MTPRRRSVFKAVILLCAVTLIPRPAFARRVVDISIQLDGKPYMWGGTSDNGSTPPAAVWRYLTSTELRPVEGVEVSAEASDPLKATLRGKITIEVRYGGKADVPQLRLVRRAASAGWTVGPEDVERIAKDIGLGKVPVVAPASGPSAARPSQTVPAAADGFPWPWVAGGGAAALLLVAGAIMLIRRRKGAGRA